MTERSVEISQNVFRVGTPGQLNELNTNIYLLTDGDESVLFGCGSAVDFDNLFADITGITTIDQLKYIILQDSDSSLCSGLPRYEQNGFTGKIITHLNSSPYIKYYGIKSEIVYSNLTANRLFLKSGRVIRFFNTPYLKSAGSFSAFDAVSGILFSGDLFGGIPARWSLYAGDDYFRDMKKYHSAYIPDNYILQNALENIAMNDISMIAPHHGSIIRENIPEAVSSLMDTQCGSFLTKIKFSNKNQYRFIDIINDILKHYYSLFTAADVREIFRESSIFLNEETGFIESTDPGILDIWNYFFELIVSRKGYGWLTLIENELHSLTCEYKIEYPHVYNSSIYKLEQKYLELEKEKLSLADNLRTIEMNPDYNPGKDPLAQVYKEDMFRENLVSDIEVFRDIGIDFAFFIIEIDNLPAFNIKYGREAGDELLANTAYLLKNFKKSRREYAHHLIFRMNGPRFTYYCNDVSRDRIISIAEEVRTEFRESELFITKITVSMGVVHSGEFSSGEKDPALLSESIIEVANSRLRLAKHRGTDSVCSESETAACFDMENYIMVIDPDISIRYMLETHLTRAGFRVETFPMGDEALEVIDIRKPMVIISGLMLPKMDGFSLRKKLLEDSALKDIPFILTSAIKDETSIIRAQSLGIYHYFKKPYPIIELIGLVKSLSKSGV